MLLVLIIVGLIIGIVISQAHNRKLYFIYILYFPVI